MKPDNYAELLPFYFGTIGGEERLQTERKLLEQPDALIDYFDLKREMEAGEVLPSEPSQRVWARLSVLAMKMRRSPRKTILMVSLGVAVAASLLACLLFLGQPKVTTSHEGTDRGILFDGGEPSSGGGVL